MNRKHGYSGYTGGCRCTTCRAAKADYMRGRRATARKKANEFQAATGQRHIVQWIGHGTTGYYEYGCRCRVCLAAVSSRPARARRRAAESARNQDVMATGSHSPGGQS